MRTQTLQTLAVLASLFGATTGIARADVTDVAPANASILSNDESFRRCFLGTWAPSGSPAFKVNGHALNAAQAANVAWIRECLVPRLPGPEKERAQVAARTTWWSLREGILDLSHPKVFRYSNCHIVTTKTVKTKKGKKVTVKVGKDVAKTEEPLFDCPTSLWQVGIAAGQVANYSEEAMNRILERVYGREDSDAAQGEMLRRASSLAGYSEGSDVRNGILGSKGDVRRSWLLRDPVMGFLLVEDQEVDRECLKDHKRWCFSHSYPAASKFARDRQSMLRSIEDLERIYSRD